MNEVRRCYARRIAARPRLEGRIVVVFSIGHGGHVADVTVQPGTLEDRFVGHCVARQVAGWVFPAPQPAGAVRVTYPFLFGQTD